ncbi:fimbrial protein [Escherichia coli]|nr:fimbrial protein [Escherichia coli]
MKRLHKRFLLATFCALFTATLQAADVTITVNGRVVAKPCTIQTKEANVNLGDLYTRNLQQPGSASGWHNITLSLTDCPIETSAVTAIVTGSTDNTGYYWICPYISRHLLSLNPLLACCRRYSRGER